MLNSLESQVLDFYVGFSAAAPRGLRPRIFCCRPRAPHGTSSPPLFIFPTLTRKVLCFDRKTGTFECGTRRRKEPVPRKQMNVPTCNPRRLPLPDLSEDRSEPGMCISKPASEDLKPRVDFALDGGKLRLESMAGSLLTALADVLPGVKFSKFGGFLIVLVIVLCPSNAHCVPGTDWQVTGAHAQEDVGANSYTTAYLNVSYLDPETRKMRTEKSEIGKFGDGRVGPASGVLVHVSSWEGGHTGCATPLQSSHGDGSLPQEPWIALVKRGQCNFEVKVENAFRHNAAAILVYNDRESPTLDKMKLTGTRNMSAVFTYKWKGEQLAKLVDGGSRVMVHITVATHCTRPNAHVNRTSVLFVSISFVVLMLTSLAWLVFYYVQRFRYLHAKDRLSKRLCNAAKKALSKIPTKEIQQEDREVQGDGECCAVCIEPYKVTDDLRILPCRHEFHKSCIDPWLLEHRTCPMCKMNILKHYGFVFSNSQESVLQVDLEMGETEENDALGVSGNGETQVRTETETQVDATAFQEQAIYGASPVESDEEQSNQLLDSMEYQQCCVKCCPRADKKKHNTRGTGGCCPPKQCSSPDTAQLLRKDGSNKDAKLEGNSPSHSKSCEFFDQTVCDSDKGADSKLKKSVSCKDIESFDRDGKLGDCSSASTC